MSFSATLASPTPAHPAAVLFGSPAPGNPPQPPPHTPIANATATPGAGRDPTIPRLHPRLHELLPLERWLSEKGDTSKTETSVRYYAAMPEEDVRRRRAQLRTAISGMSTKLQKRKRQQLATALCAESLVKSDTTWRLYSQMEAAGYLSVSALSSNPCVPAGLTRAIEALADAAGNRQSASAHAPAQPVAVTPAMLRAPYGIATFIQNVRLEMDTEPSPARQVKFALRSLDAESRQFVREEQQDLGEKLQSLDELAKCLAKMYPTDDELLRSHETVLSHLTSRPASIDAWYGWARSLVRANAAHARGTEKLPSGAALAMLLLGLANVPGACSTAGIHMHLRKDAVTDESGKIVLAGTITDPRGVIDYARN